MKFVLLWVIIGATADVSSGSAQFDTSRACQAAGLAIDEAAAKAALQSKTRQPHVAWHCINAASGDRR
jgi:hypothetical protein